MKYRCVIEELYVLNQGDYLVGERPQAVHQGKPSGPLQAVISTSCQLNSTTAVFKNIINEESVCSTQKPIAKKAVTMTSY